LVAQFCANTSFLFSSTGKVRKQFGVTRGPGEEVWILMPSGSFLEKTSHRISNRRISERLGDFLALPVIP